MQPDLAFLHISGTYSHSHFKLVWNLTHTNIIKFNLILRTCKINRSTRKLNQTTILIKKNNLTN